MAAPKKPNTAAATVAVRRMAQERKAAELRGAGWTVTPPADTPDTPPGTARRVRLELTSGELEALLIMCTSAEAGDLGELMGHARRYAAALRALKKVRSAAAVGRGADLDAVLAEVGAAVSGLCESAGGSQCVVQDVDHRRIYHSARPV